MKTTLAFALVLLAAVTAAHMDDGCLSVLYDMAGCMDYLTAGSEVTEPSNNECCIEFATVMRAGQGGCVCDAVKYSKKIGLDLSLAKAKKLPSICQSDIDTANLCEDLRASAPTPSMPPFGEAPSLSPMSVPEKEKKLGKAPAPAEESSSSGSAVVVSVAVRLALLFVCLYVLV